jgi:diguanylate cyclase (GGDEF)-like protein
VQTLTALLDLSRALAGTRTVVGVADLLALSLPKVLECDQAAVLTRDPETGMLVCLGHSSRDVRVEPPTSPLAAGTARRLARLARPLVLRRGSNPGAAAGLSGIAELVGFEGGVLMPVAAHEELLGALVILHDDPAHGPSTALLERLPGVAALAATALENVALLEQVQHQSMHDPLTGLPNLRLLEELSKKLAGRQESAPAEHRHAVLFVDLDGFKDINDEMGHARGDQLLVEVADRLKQDLREGDRVVRIGGDEFAVVLHEVADAEEAKVVAERLLVRFGMPFTVHDRDFLVSASIGVAVGNGEDTLEALLTRADAAMYEAKRAGRARVCVADSLDY